MKRINLRSTHKLLYRIMLIFSLGSIFIGLGILTEPYTMYANFRTLSDILPVYMWGVLWLTAGITVLLGIIFKYYLLCKAGLIAISSLCVTWGIAQVTGQFFGHTGVYSFMSTLVYCSSAITGVAILAEPPINPETAIGEINRAGD